MSTTTPGGADPIPVIVLAAGAASRFGDDDKLLAQAGDRPVLQHVLETIAYVDDADGRLATYLVVGVDQPARAALATAFDAEIVPTVDAVRGLRWSIAAGLAAVPDGAPGAVLLLGDDPLAARSLAPVLAAAIDQPERIAYVDRAGGAPHPVYLPRASWPEPPLAADDRGLRSLLDAGAWDPIRIEADPAAPSLDVDTPADLAELTRRVDEPPHSPLPPPTTR